MNGPSSIQLKESRNLGDKDLSRKPPFTVTSESSMDDKLLETIAALIQEHQYSIAKALDIPLGVQCALKDRYRGQVNDGRINPFCLGLLQWWRDNRARDDGEGGGRRKLWSVLLEYGLKDAASRLFPDQDTPEEYYVVRPRSVIDKPRSLDDPALLTEIAKMPRMPTGLASYLHIGSGDVKTLERQCPRNAPKLKMLLLQTWVAGHRSIYSRDNLGRQLCKILLKNGLDREADLIIPRSSYNKDAYINTDFLFYEESHAARREAISSASPSLLHYDKAMIKVDKDQDSWSKFRRLDVGFVVEVAIQDRRVAGIMRSLVMTSSWPEEEMAGIELEEPIHGGSDGVFEGHRYFQCGSGKAIFVYRSQCKPDSGFPIASSARRADFADINNKASRTHQLHHERGSTGDQAKPSFTESDHMRSKAITSDRSQTQTKECVVCCETESNATFYRCGHVCCCYDCARRLPTKTCPLCRAVIDDVIKIYL